MFNRNYYIYITTNEAKTVLYVGITKNLKKRIQEHFNNRGKPNSFAGRYYCYNLIYYEYFSSAADAIQREKEIKNLNRRKKTVLIETKNPSWRFIRP
jgi:putative endonuclease